MKITLVPYAGLCNRLNAIASGLAYIENNPGTQMSIKWHKWIHCNCRFKDIFKQLAPCYPPVREIYFDPKDVPGHKLNLFLPNKYRKFFYEFCFLPSMTADRFDDYTKDRNSVYVNKDNRFCRFSIESSLAKIFIPTDELQQRIDSITQVWGG